MRCAATDWIFTRREKERDREREKRNRDEYEREREGECEIRGEDPSSLNRITELNPPRPSRRGIIRTPFSRDRENRSHPITSIAHYCRRLFPTTAVAHPLSTPTPDCGHAWQTYHSKDWYVDRCCLRCTRVFVSPVYIYTILSFEERERLEEPPPRWNYLLDTGWEIVCFFWRGKGLDDFVSSEGRMGGVNEESWTRKVPGVNWFITWPQFL